MMMKLPKASALVTALLTASLFLAVGARAQVQGDPPAKAAPKSKAKRVKAAAAAPQAPGASAPAVAKPEAAGKRDPFEPLINQHKDNGAGIPLPPGKAGLVVATVRVDGTIHSPNGMIAIVSNPEQHVYFIREGDRLYDGDVEKIGLDGVTFRENSKDAFGKAIDRMVTKRIYASAGEQQ
jgi:Tfp pilus assembly protein PilP